MTPQEIAAAHASADAKRSRDRGEFGQRLALQHLERMGVAMPEYVHTPWRIIRNALGKILKAIALEKVSGDIRGLLSGGRSVLAEVKLREGDLPFTALEPHQHRALAVHESLGGLSLVVYVHPVKGMDYGVAVFKYRDLIAPGWISGVPLKARVPDIKGITTCEYWVGDKSVPACAPFGPYIAARWRS